MSRIRIRADSSCGRMCKSSFRGQERGWRTGFVIRTGCSLGPCSLLLVFFVSLFLFLFLFLLFLIFSFFSFSCTGPVPDPVAQTTCICDAKKKGGREGARRPFTTRHSSSMSLMILPWPRPQIALYLKKSWAQYSSTSRLTDVVPYT